MSKYSTDALLNRMYEREADARQALAAIDTLFEAIRHGDEQHQSWLKEKLEQHLWKAYEAKIRLDLPVDLEISEEE